MDNNAEVNRLVKEGITAVRAGRKEDAEELLRQALTIDPRNEKAWLWLSAAVEGIDEKKECLRRVLDINPGNPFARSGMRFLSHLREGYEYMAARAPWVMGVEDGQESLEGVSSQTCPRCGAVNPGWSYLCNQCSAVLEPVDVTKAVKEQMREDDESSSLVRPWSGAFTLDAQQAFAPEVTLASPLRAVMVILMGGVALNLLRFVGALEQVAFGPTRLPMGLVDRLMVSFIGDQVGLMVGSLLVWVLLATVTHTLARSQGGLGEPLIHYYLVAVATSAWLPITGLTGLIWWTISLFFPVPVPLLVGLTCGLLFFYAISLLAQAIYTAHGLRSSRVMVMIGGMLAALVLIYFGLVYLSPSYLQSSLVKVLEVLLLPVSP